METILKARIKEKFMITYILSQNKQFVSNIPRMGGHFTYYETLVLNLMGKTAYSHQIVQFLVNCMT